MKKLFSLLLIMAVVLGVSIARAVPITEEVPFVVSASIPSASGINIVATQVNASDDSFGAQVSALNFNPMSYNSNLGIWVPNHYFAIDVGASGGAGNPNITVSYGSESSPTGQLKGLGYKTTANFVKITGPNGSQVETPLAAHGPKKLLASIAGGEEITAAEITGGFLRVYVGVYTGDNQALTDLGGEPFTNSDKPGTYQGTLTVTATIP